MTKKLCIVFTILMLLLSSIVYAANGDNPDYDIDLKDGYISGKTEIPLNWTAVDSSIKLTDVVKVGDYINYNIPYETIQNNYQYIDPILKSKIAVRSNNTLWRVIYSDEKTVKIVSVQPVGTVSIGTDKNYGFSSSYYGQYSFDNGGFGLEYTMDALAKCYIDYKLATDARTVDFKDIQHTDANLVLKQALGNEMDEVDLTIDPSAYSEIYDTERHFSLKRLFYRNYEFDVAKFNDTTNLYYGGKFLISNYFNGNGDINAVYYANGANIKLSRVNPKGQTVQAGIKVVVTLKEDLFEIDGNGTQTSPWEISNIPGGATYKIYQKIGENGTYAQKVTTKETNFTFKSKDGISDQTVPYTPNMEMYTIPGDKKNVYIELTGIDEGTTYYHKITSQVGKKVYTSNEIETTVIQGIKGFYYKIDTTKTMTNANTLKSSGKFIAPGNDIKVSRANINAKTTKYIHIVAVDNGGKLSAILNKSLTYSYGDLSLISTYQDAKDIDSNGIARTAGWNYIDLKWEPQTFEGTVVYKNTPNIVFVLDTSGSMEGDRINSLRKGANQLIDHLFDEDSDTQIGIVEFASGAYNRTGNLWGIDKKEALKNIIWSLSPGGMTAAGSGIRTADSMLDGKENGIIITITDGYSNRGTSPPVAIREAKAKGYQTISVMVNMYNDYQFRESNKLLYTSDENFYKTVAEDLSKTIKEIIESKYSLYKTSHETANAKNSIVVKDTTSKENTDGRANDKAAPTKPIVTIYEEIDQKTNKRTGYLKYNIWAEDLGTVYEFYVTANNSKSTQTYNSNAVTQEVKTGIQGYAWSITDKKSDDPGRTVKPLPTVNGKEGNTIDKSFIGKWLHIRAIDYAGNAGEKIDIKLETNKYIPWEELNRNSILFCIQHGQTIPAQSADGHLNAVVRAGTGKYAINEIVLDPKEGDRLGSKFVEGTTRNIYGTNPIYSYSFGKYEISSETPKRAAGKEGNATDIEAYILNYYAENNSLSSAVQTAMYQSEISRGNISWDFKTTLESSRIIAEATAYANTRKKGFNADNIKLNTKMYMDEKYQDIVLGPLMLNYEPEGVSNKGKDTYFSRIIGMKVYDQNNKVISELNRDGNNVGDIQVEFIYSGADNIKRKQTAFTKEKYKFPVGFEEFYIKFKYKASLENVTKFSKIEFIHGTSVYDAQYNVLTGTYNKVRWIPNSKSVYCDDVKNGYTVCKHGKKQRHLIGSYFYLTAHIEQKGLTSQKLLEVQWTKVKEEVHVQKVIPDSGILGGPDSDDDDEWKLFINISGNIWDDGMEDKNNGIKEDIENGIEKVKVIAYGIDSNKKRNGIEYSTYSNEVGNYYINNMRRGLYELVFVYNGQDYKSTKLLVNGSAADYQSKPLQAKYKNNSVAQETANDRRIYNKSFEEITGVDTALGGSKTIPLEYKENYINGEKVARIQTYTRDGYTKGDFEIKSSSISSNITYPRGKVIRLDNVRYLELVDNYNVNFGLAERYKTDANLKTDVYETTFSIKGKKQSYIYSEKDIRNINSNKTVSNYIQEINKADYNWKLEDILNKAPDEDTKQRLKTILGTAEDAELKAEIDYIIVIRNSGEKDSVQIAELADYFTKDLEYVRSWAGVKYDDLREDRSRDISEEIPIEWNFESKYNTENKYSSEYNRMYTTGLDRKELRFKKGEFLEIHIVFRPSKKDGKIELDDSSSPKQLMAEINGYKTYYVSDGSVAGLIDVDSKPGNANPLLTRNDEEDDENKAPDLIFKLAEGDNGGTGNPGGPNGTNGGNEENGPQGPGNYGNVLEGNVWEDLRTGNNINKLVNNKIISDGYRQDGEPEVQNVNVELIEYYEYPNDASKDVYIPLTQQRTRTVYSLSNGETLGGGYSFTNLSSGNYMVKFVYGDAYQLQNNLKYNGQDYQGLSTKDIYGKDGVKVSYEDVEILLTVDISGSMNKTVDLIRKVGSTITDTLSNQLPNVKIGLTTFNNIAGLKVKQESNNDSRLKDAIKKLGANGNTAIGYGIDTSNNSYSQNAKQKIMIILTDAEETVQNVEQVIKSLEKAVDENDVSVATILTKENKEIFGTAAEPRRGAVYEISSVQSDAAIENIIKKIVSENVVENRRSNAKDVEGNLNDPKPGTRAYNIKPYQIMDAKNAPEIAVENIKTEEQIKILADKTYMTAESIIVNYKPNNVKGNTVHELNLALMERPKTQLKILEDIIAIKVILSDGTVLIDTSKGLNKNINGLEREGVPITIYMDDEIMHGANLIVDYRITLRNEGEIDTLSSYITGESDETVPTSANLIVNYASKNMLYYGGSFAWDMVEITGLKDKLSTYVYNDLRRRENNKTYQTKELNIKLYPEGSKEVIEGRGKSEDIFYVTLSKLITPEDAEMDLTFNSSLEILERENKVGRRAIGQVPGDYIPDSEVNIMNPDQTKARKIIITKPWGQDRRTIFIEIGIAISTVIALGTWYLKRKMKNH
ncbi:MAG: VWA domain-containing protein [Clostridia bacterium]|nr:VWA domain-containing protein [Clostridia bacterium]